MVSPRKTRERERKNKETRVIFSARDQIILILMVLIIGAIAVGGVVVTSDAADVQYKMNKLIQENATITGEIENLSVKLDKANNIQAIEKKAVTTLGMVYPNPNDFVYIEINKEQAVDFALLLKEESYN